jgi:hypothetical protein
VPGRRLLMQNKKCISDRILNYLESYLDKLRNGYTSTYYKNATYDANNTFIHYDIKYKLDFDWEKEKKYTSWEKIEEQKTGPLSFLTEETFNLLRTDIIEYYNNNIRGEMEYTNQNPITIAGIIIFKFLRLSPNIVFKASYGSFLTYIISTSVLENEIIQRSGFGMKMRRIKIPPIGHYFDERYGPLPKFEHGKGGQVMIMGDNQ